jgi:hypothetical protein
LGNEPDPTDQDSRTSFPDKIGAQTETFQGAKSCAAGSSGPKETAQPPKRLQVRQDAERTVKAHGSDGGALDAFSSAIGYSPSPSSTVMLVAMIPVATQRDQ